MSKDGMFGIADFDRREYAISANAMLGIRDSGKTYDAMKAAEELFDAGIPSFAFDPIGVWHSIRIPGKGKGYPFVVAGGRHGDLPLTPKNCGAIVRAAMEAGVSLVIDLFSRDLVKADWRRIVRECTEILLHENEEYGLRHIFIEEAAEFVPQRVQDGQVFAAVEKVVRMGGNSKLGCTLINQRSADINKSVLELCANVFVHRQKGKNTLLDLRKWFEMLELTEAEQDKIGSTLPNLKSGQCWALLHDFKKPILIQVPEKNSLHPDRRAVVTKSEADKQKPVPADAFVEAMKAKLAPKATAPKVEAVKPPVKQVTPSINEREIERAIHAARAEGFSAGWAAAWPKAHADGEETGRRQALIRVGEGIEVARKAEFSVNVTAPKAPRARKSTSSELVAIFNPVAVKAQTVPSRALSNGGDASLTGPQRKLLQSLAWWKAMGHDEVSKVQAAVICGWKITSSNIRDRLSELSSRGLIEYPRGGIVRLTAAGVDAAPSPNMNGTLVSSLRTILTGPQTKIFDVLMDHGGPLAKSEIAERCGWSPDSSNIRDRCSELSGLEIIRYPSGGVVELQDWVTE